MLDEIVSVVPFRDRYFVIYKSGRILEMEVFEDGYKQPQVTFRVPNFEIPRTFP